MGKINHPRPHADIKNFVIEDVGWASIVLSFPDPGPRFGWCVQRGSTRATETCSTVRNGKVKWVLHKPMGAGQHSLHVQERLFEKP